MKLSLLCLGVAVAGCARGPVELGFWIDPITYQSSRIDGPITPAELKVIDQTARREIETAFADYAVMLTANRDARFKVAVLPALRDERLLRGGTHAGESRAIAGLGGSGAVSFEYVANSAMAIAPESMARADLIAAIGRGIGRVAIHEFVHQLLPKSPLHDATNVRSYEGNSPTIAEGFFGELQWDIAAPWLESRLAPRAVVRP